MQASQKTLAAQSLKWFWVTQGVQKHCGLQKVVLCDASSISENLVLFLHDQRKMKDLRDTS